MSSHHHQPHAADGSATQPAHIPYWQRAHTDWRFWFGVMLMFIAMIVYVLSFDLALRPRPQPKQSVSGATER